MFSQFLDAAVKIPLPPYFHREAELSDLERYQTVFSKFQGSVAAPTVKDKEQPRIQRGESPSKSEEEATHYVESGSAQDDK